MEEGKISAAQFFNLLKQYWKSHPDLSFSDIWMVLIDENLAVEFGIYPRIKDVILSETEAFNKLTKLNQENSDIDNFFTKFSN